MMSTWVGKLPTGRDIVAITVLLLVSTTETVCANVFTTQALGWVGAVGVTLFDAAEAGPGPLALLATTVKV